MKCPPLILISPSTESKGAEFGDTSMSLSENYPAPSCRWRIASHALPVPRDGGLAALRWRAAHGRRHSTEALSEQVNAATAENLTQPMANAICGVDADQ
jgi:hypothetical protein